MFGDNPIIVVTPSREDEHMESTSIRFAGAARELSRASRLCGVSAPNFTSPPRLEGYNRTMRRTRRGTTVAIQLRGRPWAAVLADMVDGVVVANELSGQRADQIRAALWNSLLPAEVDSVIAA